MELTGKDIHNAFRRVEPEESRDFEDISLVAQRYYEGVADELNKLFRQNSNSSVIDEESKNHENA